MAKGKRRSTRKKVYYKKKTKGVRYIAQRLRKYFPKKYKTYSEALAKAREINSSISSSGGKVNLESIFNLERKKRGPKKPQETAPEIDPALLESRAFWNLEDYPNLIATNTDRIWFRSKISPAGLPDIQGGDTPSYHDYFSEYVAFCNKLMKLSPNQPPKSDDAPLVCCTEPKLLGDKWISLIIGADTNNDELDYGFDPENPEMIPYEYVTNEGEKLVEAPRPPEKGPEIEEKAPPAPEKLKEPSVELELAREATKKAEAEAVKAKAVERQQYNEMFLKGLITKDEWKQLIG